MGSHSSTRAVGAILHRISNGVSSKWSPNSFALSKHGLLSRNLFSSALSISSRIPLYEVKHCNFQVRTIRTFAPVCMGRRSSKIAGRKGAQDAKKAKLYSRIGKEVISAVKKGGPNPTSNTVLAAVLEKAKELDVPKDIVERNIKRASEKGQEAFIEKVYEVDSDTIDNFYPDVAAMVYGYGGVSIVVEVLTDKITRSVAAVREVVKDCGGKMADPGSVMFKFSRARVVNIKVTDADKDQLLDIALDAGAEDVIEPPVNEDDTDEDRAERYYKVVSTSENYTDITTKLREAGIPFETDNGSELLPITTIEVDDEAMELNKELISKLLELDDVDAVYTDQIWLN
ncbi:probable transcriptional regulatory protein At2g25830 isoform X1 [Citrus clementina]|uniref:probable transcriptional regulatory protein At2g25830 isoform X1 n=2 Tax=Citrus clementina TaxID=85681 RepID=UPI000CED64B0|nr:probable transcriptional regulatory protein At2g25830 isoform X1 [Citrus x clementina]